MEFDVADPEGTKRRWFYDVTQTGCEQGGGDKCTYPAGQPVKMTFAAPGCPNAGICEEWFGNSSRAKLIYRGRKLPDSNGYLFNFSSTYDNAQRLTRSVYPDGRGVDFNYDGSGRLVALHQGNDKLVEVEYNDKNMIQKKTYIIVTKKN